MIHAVKSGRIDIVKLLLSDNRVNIDYKDKCGMTALIWAVTSSNIPMCQLLIKNKPDMDIKTVIGDTALILSVLNLDIGKMLVKNGANVDIKNNKGKTAYEEAEESSKAPFMYFLNPENVNNDFLIKACREKQVDNILFLYERALPGGVDFYIENDKEVSAWDVLKVHEELPLKLQALRDRLSLNRLHDNTDDDSSLSL